MKYINEVIINAPLATVVDLFKDPANMKEWQPELINVTPIMGTPGTVGAKSKIVSRLGNGKIEMIETIKVANLPDAYDVVYEAPGVINTMKSKFVAVGSNETQWLTDNEFVFTSIVMKLMGFFAGGMFKKQTQTTLDLFKTYAETVVAEKNA